MIVILFNREEITVSKAEAENIQLAIQNDMKWIKIGDYTLRPNSIMLIKPGGYTEADRITDDSRILDRPDYRGRPSAAKEELRKKFSRA